jgi:hypothetical protein
MRQTESRGPGSAANLASQAHLIVFSEPMLEGGVSDSANCQIPPNGWLIFLLSSDH